MNKVSGVLHRRAVAFEDFAPAIGEIHPVAFVLEAIYFAAVLLEQVGYFIGAVVVRGSPGERVLAVACGEENEGDHG